MPKLFLHIGPAKTGTSAIQHALRRHDDSVVVYPKVGLWPDGAHHNLVFNFNRNFARPDVERIDVEAALAEIGASARRAQRPVVVSSEALFGAQLRPLIGALLEAIGAEIGEAEILVVHREPFARLASLYNQRVKDHHIRETRAPDAFLRENARVAAYAAALARAAATGAAVRLIAYAPSADFAARFLAHLGFGPADMPTLETRNPSLSNKALVALLAANRAGLAPAAREALFAALRRQGDYVAPARFLFSAQAAREIEPLLREDREALATRWGFDAPAVDVESAQGGLAPSPEEMEAIDAACGALEAGAREAMRAALAGLCASAGR